MHCWVLKDTEASMAEEGDAFYVVRKGDIIGVYKNLRDCQNQAGSSVNFYYLIIYVITFQLDSFLVLAHS